MVQIGLNLQNTENRKKNKFLREFFNELVKFENRFHKCFTYSINKRSKHNQYRSIPDDKNMRPDNQLLLQVEEPIYFSWLDLVKIPTNKKARDFG